MEQQRMPRTKTKPKTTPLAPPAKNGGLVVATVLSLPEAATYLRLGEEEVLRLVCKQNLPARQVGSEWRFLKTAIDDWLSRPLTQQNKEGVWAFAGAWKNDPHAAQMLKDIYRKRGRPMTEGG